MSDEMLWRLDAHAVPPAGAASATAPPHDSVASAVQGRVPSEVVISEDWPHVFVYGPSREAVESARDAVVAEATRTGWTVNVAVDRWSEPDGAWRQMDGPPSRVAELAERQRDDDEWDPRSMSARQRAVAFAASLAAAVGGVTWYGLTPDVGSYQASLLLALPLVLLALEWLHRRLPMWLQWTGALVMAPLGPVGYLVEGGSQWWNWGQFTVVPLTMLLLSRTWLDDSGREPWYGGPAEGPWGPP